jgi:hypothetical protein
LPLGGFVTPGHTIPYTIVTRLGGLAVCLDLAGDECINAGHRREKGRRRPLDRTVHRIVFGVARAAEVITSYAFTSLMEL